jgi:hypothetical protein
MKDVIYVKLLRRRVRGRQGSPDVTVTRLPHLSWQPEDIEESLATLYDRAETAALEAVEWYLTEKISKARWSRALRLMAILLAAAGGLVPLVNSAGVRSLDVRWGFVLLALAAACIAVDRYFGLSAAWMRYMRAALLVRGSLSEFQFEWAHEQAKASGRPASPEHVADRLRLLMRFSQVTHRHIEQETVTWIRDFQASLAQFESTTQGRPRLADEGNIGH